MLLSDISPCTTQAHLPFAERTADTSPFTPPFDEGHRNAGQADKAMMSSPISSDWTNPTSKKIHAEFLFQFSYGTGQR